MKDQASTPASTGKRIDAPAAAGAKAGNYLKYAVGEILLVVIGIIIALQINNYNQNRVNDIKLRSYLVDIVKDFKTDTMSIRINIARANNRMNTSKTFLALEDYNALTIEEIEASLETFYTRIPLSNSTFEKIESSGITNFGQYEALIEDYKIYYNIIIPDNMSFEGTHNRAVDIEDNYWRYRQDEYEFTYVDELGSYQSKEDAKSSLIRLVQAPIARNILKIDYRRNKNTIERLKKLNVRVIKLIDDTEAKLNE
jgi:hypothetical protein